MLLLVLRNCFNTVHPLICVEGFAYIIFLSILPPKRIVNMRLPVFVRPLALGGCLSAVVDLVVAQSDPPGGEQNPFIIEDDLDSLGWWKDTQVKKGLWSQVVGKLRTEDFTDRC